MPEEPVAVPGVSETIDAAVFEALSRGPEGRLREALAYLCANPALDWAARTIDALARLAASSDAALAAEALSAASRTGFRAAGVPVIASMLKDPAPARKIAALRLAEGYGAQGTVLADSILPLLESASPAVAEKALQALAATGLSPSSVGLLSQLFRHREGRVRVLCVRLLELLGARAGALSGLAILRLDDPEAEVRTAAAEALASTGFHPAALEEVGRMLTHANRARRLDMLRILAQFGSSAEAASPLVIPLLKSEDDELRGEARRTLRATGLGRECLRSIAQLSAHPVHSVRMAAADLLEECGASPELCGIAAAMMADRDSALRGRAARILAKCGAPAAALPALRKLLRDERAEVRLQALSALAGAGAASAPAAKLILERVEDADTDVARAAAAAFAACGAVDGNVAELSRLLHNRRQDRRLLILSTLRGMGADAAAALPLVTAAMGDADWLVRDAACEAVLAIGFHESCLPEVRRLIGHQDRNYRLAVIKALGACGMNAAAAKDFLQKRVEDADAEVGRAARAALKAVTGAD